MSDGLRLALGTLTAVRVPPPRRVDPRSARAAMVWAPLVGLLLGVAAEVSVLLVRWAIHDWADRGVAVAAVMGVATLAALTRGLHLDGLADTADGLGSGLSGPSGVAVMSRSDIGPFGVVTVLMVVLLQVTALAVAILDGRGTLALVGGAVVARLALTWAARSGVPAARETGLGAGVAGTVPATWALVATGGVALALAGLTVLDDDLTRAFVLHTLAAAAVALVASQLLVRHAVRRFGGITGDVLGASVEVAFCVFVVGVAVG